MNKRRIVKIVFLLIVISWSGIVLGQANTGAIIGTITDGNRQPLANVNVTIPGSVRGAASNERGEYRIENLAPGTYTVTFSHISYYPVSQNQVQVRAEQITRLDLILSERVLQLQEIIVTPGSFVVSQSQTARQQAIAKEKIAAIPATLDDICRVVQIMPGVSFSDDFSAHFHVRGGKQKENLILMDGMEIFDPYHLKDIGGAVGVMNLEIIDNVSIMTGGFSAKYGDRLSSVLTVANRIGRTDKFAGNLVAGGTGASAVLEGPMPAGSWLVSFRKSFLKEAAKFLNPTDYTFSPSYYDAQVKLHFAPGKANQLSINMLYSRDDTYLEKWREKTDLYSDYGNRYNGLTWKSVLRPNLFSELVLSNGKNFWDNRAGKDREEKLTLTENVGNWNINWQPTGRHSLELGLTAKQIQYDYSLKAAGLSLDQQSLDELVESYYGSGHIHSTTAKYAAFFQDQMRILPRLVANLGLRYDYFAYNRDQQLSPRVGIAFTIHNKTVLRAAWGHYFQSPSYTDLTHQRGAAVNPKAEKSCHYVLGIEHFLSDHLSVRMEGYIKSLSRMIGYYFEPGASGEAPRISYGNPYHGECRGVEFFVNGRLSRRLSVWLAYAWSASRIEGSFVDWDSRSIETRVVPRFTDQPHNLALFLNYRIGKSWVFNLKWRYLSGIPYTPAYPAWDWQNQAFWRHGDYFSARYPAYHRLDIRIGKNYSFENQNLSIFLEVKNIYHHKNVLLYHYEIKDGRHQRTAFYTIPFLPTVEFNWHF